MNYLQHGQKVSVLILFLLFSLNITVALETSDDFVSVDELATSLETGNIDRILNMLNAIKQMSYQGEILPFVYDLWNGREDKYPDLSWKIVNEDIIKVELANILLQAESNGRVEIDKAGLHKFVLKLVNSKDVGVVRSAISTLALTDDEGDVSKIFSIAIQQKKGTFRVSILALAEMCNSAAGKALDKLEKDVEKPELKSFITETRINIKAFKERTRWCE